MIKIPPFSPEEVKNINDFQESGYWHQLTCDCGDHIALEARLDGLWCPRCGKIYDWVHDWIADRRWELYYEKR